MNDEQTRIATEYVARLVCEVTTESAERPTADELKALAIDAAAAIAAGIDRLGAAAISS